MSDRLCLVHCLGSPALLLSTVAHPFDISRLKLRHAKTPETAFRRRRNHSAWCVPVENGDETTTSHESRLCFCVFSQKCYYLPPPPCVPLGEGERFPSWLQHGFSGCCLCRCPCLHREEVCISQPHVCLPGASVWLLRYTLQAERGVVSFIINPMRAALAYAESVMLNFAAVGITFTHTPNLWILIEPWIAICHSLHQPDIATSRSR